MKIRKANPEEAKKIKDLLSTTWVDTYSSMLPDDVIKTATTVWHNVDTLKDEINNDIVYFAVAEEDDGNLAGLTTVWVQDDNSLFMTRLYVDPSRQRQGIGKQLFDSIFKHFNKSNSMKLEVEKENAKAYNFYQKIGFKPTSEKDLEIGGKTIPVVEMEKKLI